MAPTDCPIAPSANLSHIPWPVLQPEHLSATNVLPAYQATLECGVSPDEVKERLGWSLPDLQNTDFAVSGSSTYEHFEWMYGLPNYPKFLMASVANHTPSSLGIIGLACKTARTLGEAMSRHARFQTLTNQTTVYETQYGSEFVELIDRRHGPERLGKSLVSDYSLLVATHLLRTMAGESLKPMAFRSTRTSMPSEERQAMESFLGVAVQPGDKPASLRLSRVQVDSPLPGADQELSQYFDERLHQALPVPPVADPLLREVGQAVACGLARGAADLPAIAKALKMSVRTLQRRLTERSTNFGNLLEDTRKQLARNFLADPKMSIAEVAYLLGYAEQSSFFRAFHQWYGTSPRQLTQRF